MRLEALVEELVRSVSEAEVAEAQQEFFALTGPYESGDAWYEERSRAFFDWLVSEWQQGRVVRRFRDAEPRSEAELEACAGLLAHMRGIFRVEVHRAPGTDEARRVHCLIGGAAFALTNHEGGGARLREGDIFDGRVVAHAGAIELMPGPVFHPRRAHEALLSVVQRAATEGRDARSVCDSLMRMRMRFDRFTSMQARHVYRFDALDRREILAASWARG